MNRKVSRKLRSGNLGHPGMVWAIALIALVLNACAAGDFGAVTNQVQQEPEPVVLPTDTPEPEPTAAPTEEPAEEPTLEPAPPADSALPRGGVTVGGGADLERLIERAKENIVQSANVGADEITVVSTEQVEWNDSSLGCPQPGSMYAQVITPGFRILLEADGKAYEFHSGMNGEGPLVLCNR